MQERLSLVKFLSKGYIQEELLFGVFPANVSLEMSQSVPGILYGFSGVLSEEYIFSCQLPTVRNFCLIFLNFLWEPWYG